MIKGRYGNLFDMYQKITDEDPYAVPMRIYPAIHYTMGGLWVDYNLMSNVPGLHVLGEANFSDHGANRLGASALMQGLADGYFVIPYTLRTTSAARRFPPSRPITTPSRKRKHAVQARIDTLLRVKGTRRRGSCTAVSAQLLWDHVGMARNETGLKHALAEIPRCATSSGRTCRCPARPTTLNKNLEYAGRVADYLEFAEVLALDALQRTESCGGHFREESQTPEGEALRDDAQFLVCGGLGVQGRRRASPRCTRNPSISST